MPAIDTTVLEGDLLLRGVWEGLGAPDCHLIGGYVRDRLLGRESVDLDLVLPGSLETAAGPARRLAARLDTRAHVIGREGNRVWRIETPAIKIELWPLGHLDLDDDIQRRDFAFNALVWHLPQGPLDDRVGGIEDLEQRVIRALSRHNLEDDPVRLVRAPRFVAQLDGFTIDPRTAGWIRELAFESAAAPRERVGQELLRLFEGRSAGAGIQALMELGLFEPTAPAAAACDRRWLERHLGAASRLTGAAAHPVPAAVRASGSGSRLALLLRAWGIPDSEAVTAYAWSRGARGRAVTAAKLLERSLASVAAPVATRRAFIHESGNAFPTTLALAAAIDPDHPWDRWWRLWRERGSQLVDPQPLLSSDEVGAVLQLGPGPALGRAIGGLIRAQVRGHVRTAAGARRWLRTTFEPQ